MSLVLLPRHPPHMWKYYVTRYHSHFRAPLTRASDSDLQLRKQLAHVACFFFLLLLRFWTCGLAWCSAQPATTGWLLLEAELSVCFHCTVGSERWGVPWSTFEWGLWDACGVKIALCTQWIGKHAMSQDITARGLWILVLAFLYLSTT